MADPITDIVAQPIDALASMANKKVRVLEIYKQGIEKVPSSLSSIGKFTFLRRLDLSGNLLCNLPNEIKNLANLLAIDLLMCVNLQELPSKKKLLRILERCSKLQHITVFYRGTKVMDHRKVAAEEPVFPTPWQSDSCIISIYEDNPAPSLSNNLFAHVLKTIWSKMIGNKHSFKLMLAALNITAEVGQAAISQKKNVGKMGSNLYLELSIIISSFCLMMVLLEAFYEVRKHGVVWKKRGHFGRGLYRRDNQGRLFGSLSLYFGFISSMIQLIIHLTEKLTKNYSIIKFDYTPSLLAFCYLVAAIIDHQGEVSRTDQVSIIEDHESRLLGYGDDPAELV